MKLLDAAGLGSLTIAAGSAVNEASTAVTVATIVISGLLQGLRLYLSWRQGNSNGRY